MDQIMAEPMPLHSGCLHHAIINGVRLMMGFDGCSNSYLAYLPWALLCLLYLSTIIRYRAYAVPGKYRPRSSPKIYARLTSVPWEALLAFLLTLPRLYWVLDFTTDAILKNEAWQHKDFTHWFCWSLLFYVCAFDIIERRLLYTRLLRPYWETKRRDAEVVDVKTMLLEGRQSRPTQSYALKDAEKGGCFDLLDAQMPAQRRSWRQRLALIFTIKYPQATAENVLAQYQILAFIKAAFTFIFLSEIGLSACNLEPKDILNSQYSITPVMLIISAISLGRFVQLVRDGWRFATELDWDAVEHEQR